MRVDLGVLLPPPLCVLEERVGCLLIAGFLDAELLPDFRLEHAKLSRAHRKPHTSPLQLVPAEWWYPCRASVVSPCGHRGCQRSPPFAPLHPPPVVPLPLSCSHCSHHRAHTRHVTTHRATIPTPAPPTGPVHAANQVHTLLQALRPARWTGQRWQPPLHPCLRSRRRQATVGVSQRGTARCG